MRSLSTESLLRAWLFRAMPSLFEQPGESLGNMDPAPPRLVDDGTPSDPIRVLGREHVTLQGYDIAGTWSIEASLDGTDYAEVATIAADGFTTLDPGCYGYLRASGGSGGTILLAAAK